MAALPVGAQITIFLPIFLKLSTSPTINVLFPEPGPPVIIEKDCFKDLFIESVDPKFENLDSHTVGCSRLPHGKYRFQVHMKKDAQLHITDTQRDNLRNFLERNVDHCLVPGYALLDYLENKSPYCFGGYFYVTQDQFITPIYMMAQEAIDKVIQFKKVENGSDKKTTR